PDLRLSLAERAHTASNPRDEPLAGERREVAADGDLRNRKHFRKFRNRDRIAGLEDAKDLAHPLLLRQTGKLAGTFDARDPMPPLRTCQWCVPLAFETNEIESRFVNGARIVQTPRHGSEAGSRAAGTARDRDAVVGLRELRHALPRLPLAGRGAV